MRRRVAGAGVLCACLAFATCARAAPPGAASRPAGHEPIVIFRDAGRYNSFPDVKRLPDGRLLCVFRDASFPERVLHIEADARIVGALSSDNGRHWSKPFVVYDDASCQNDPSVAVLRDGRLALTFFNWDGVDAAYVAKHKPPFAHKVARGAWGEYAQPGGVHLLWGMARTPEQWESKAQRIGGTAERLRATSSSILETKSGALLLPTYGRTPEQLADRAYVCRSSDGGRTWSEEVPIAADPAGKVEMQEPALAQMPDGEIVVLMRTANAEDHLYTVHSSDDGRTWSAPERTPLIGHPADLLVLPDGKLLAVYGYRHEPFGVRACVSDDGRRWDRGREIIIADAGAHTDLGYPSACLTADEHVLIAYYMNGADTRDRWIECKRIPLGSLR